MKDGITRWMTPEGSFRILAARSTEAVTEGVSLAEPVPEVADLFGRLLTGAALYQLAQAPVSRMQFDLVHDGTSGDLLVDVWPGPTIRGRMQNPRPEVGPILGDSGAIRVARSSPGQAELYRSETPLSGGGVGAALQRWVLESEQVLSVFQLVTVVGNGGVIDRAGGVLVQGLPGWTHEELEQVTACMEKTDWTTLVRSGTDPIDATETVFASLDLKQVGTDPLVYRCRCSQEAAVAAVSLLSADELGEVRGGDGEEVNCEFCGRSYRVTGADLDAAGVGAE